MISPYQCPCGCGHVYTVKLQYEARLRKQRILVYECNGSGLINRPSCGWSTHFVGDDIVDSARWEAHPDRCPNCNGSICCVNVIPVTELHDVIAWDTKEIMNPGEKERWAKALSDLKGLR